MLQLNWDEIERARIIEKQNAEITSTEGQKKEIDLRWHAPKTLSKGYTDNQEIVLNIERHLRKLKENHQ